MSQPIVPPRPQQRTQAIAESHEAAQLPQIPPRPAGHASQKAQGAPGTLLDRSISPANYPQSPLNEPYGLVKTRSNEPIQRPPSVSRLPMSGEEGMEYGEIQYQPRAPVSALGADAAAQTRQISQDLPMHAPKPSLSKQSATAQVQGVTRTDSSVAVAHGIGRPPSQDGEPVGRTRSRASLSRPDSAASGERRRSIYAVEHDHGPAELGMRVPINPLLGDVQAPSPAGLSPHHTGGSPADNRKRQHSRQKSGREDFLPPGSYGLHGHGLAPSDKFEKDWYAKHPEQLEHEEGHGHGVYESIGSGRGSFALSSDDLNKIVRNTASRGHGFGTTGNVVSYPDEQIGYMASEQYQSKHTTPTQTPLQSATIYRTHSISEPPMQSPLRKASFPVDDVPPTDLHRGSTSQDARISDSDIEPVHIDAPARRFNKVTGGQGTIREKDEVRPYASHPIGENGHDDEHEYRVPILAEDEVAKGGGYEHLQPAVSPVHQRRGSGYDEHGESNSRPSSRPGSIYNLHSASNSLSRFHSHLDEREHMHTPLEDVDEYEPLFPEDDGKSKALSAAERFKRRPDSLRHRFPSQDVWEDTPSSAMYEATVSTPDLPSMRTFESDQTAEPSSATFETPETEAARKGEPSEEEKKKLIPVEQRLAKSRFAPHLRDDMPTRPGMQPRFPSQDVWEDSPDSQSLYATVNEPEEETAKSPPKPIPAVPARPAKSRLGEGASSAQIAPSVQPDIPPRTQKIVHAVPPVDAKLTDISNPPVAETSPTELKKVPSIPDRPKPQIPARPAKNIDSETLTKVTSVGSTESTETERGFATQPIPKTKPQVPARPQGSKIANLRSNFMNDLNQKLGMGPPKEKEPEPIPEPDEVKPLDDARKGRARGPQRRAPAKSPSAPTQTVSFSMSQPQSLWHIGDDGLLNVSIAKAKSELSSEKLEQIQHSTLADAPLPPTLDTRTKAGIEAEKRPEDAPKPLAPSLATNTAGEYVDPVSTGADENINVGKQTTVSDRSAGISEHSDVHEPLEEKDTNVNTDVPKEPMPENDVNYGKLEQMTATADGKGHAAEEGSSV